MMAGKDGGSGGGDKRQDSGEPEGEVAGTARLTRQKSTSQNLSSATQISLTQHHCVGSDV